MDAMNGKREPAGEARARSTDLARLLEAHASWTPGADLWPRVRLAAARARPAFRWRRAALLAALTAAAALVTVVAWPRPRVGGDPLRVTAAVTEVRGEVRVAGKALAPGDSIEPGAEVQVERGRLAFALGEARVIAGSFSLFSVTRSHKLRLARGRVHVNAPHGTGFTVEHAGASHDAPSWTVRTLGTVFQVWVDKNDTSVDVIEGEVAFAAGGRERRVPAGQAAVYDRRLGRIGPLRPSNIEAVCAWLLSPALDTPAASGLEAKLEPARIMWSGGTLRARFSIRNVSEAPLRLHAPGGLTPRYFLRIERDGAPAAAYTRARVLASGVGAPLVELAPGQVRTLTLDMAPLVTARVPVGCRVRAVYFSDGGGATWAGRVESNEITLVIRSPDAPRGAAGGGDR